MDKRLRINEFCVIGLPRCDFAFSSTRNCFIAYGFNESPLEMKILRNLLEERDIQPVEAGGNLAPGQNVFCTKICSKIITAQFCIVLLNHDQQKEQEIPNANVNMEYGLMLGFNKYVIPFQKESQTLPFNVAGFDTIKYTDQDFENKAIQAIELAIQETNPSDTLVSQVDQQIEAFLLMKKMLLTPLDTEGEKNLYQMGQPLGFNLLNNFAALQYTYFGNFTTFRAENALWRLKTLAEILTGREESLVDRLHSGRIVEAQVSEAQRFFESIQIWIVITSTKDKNIIEQEIANYPIDYELIVFSLEDVVNELMNLP